MTVYSLDVFALFLTLDFCTRGDQALSIIIILRVNNVNNRNLSKILIVVVMATSILSGCGTSRLVNEYPVELAKFQIERTYPLQFKGKVSEDLQNYEYKFDEMTSAYGSDVITIKFGNQLVKYSDHLAKSISRTNKNYKDNDQVLTLALEDLIFNRQRDTPGLGGTFYMKVHWQSEAKWALYDSDKNLIWSSAISAKITSPFAITEYGETSAVVLPSTLEFSRQFQVNKLMKELFTNTHLSITNSDEVQLYAKYPILYLLNSSERISEIERNRNNTNIYSDLMRIAALQDDLDLTKYLVSRGATDTNPQGQYRSALHWSIIYQRSKMVAEILKTSNRIDHIDRAGITPLHYAAWLGNQEIIHSLLDNAKDLDISDHTKLRSTAFLYQGFGDYYEENKNYEQALYCYGMALTFYDKEYRLAIELSNKVSWEETKQFLAKLLGAAAITAGQNSRDRDMQRELKNLEPVTNSLDAKDA